jgi:hypothetical protein
VTGRRKPISGNRKNNVRNEGIKVAQIHTYGLKNKANEKPHSYHVNMNF